MKRSRPVIVALLVLLGGGFGVRGSSAAESSHPVLREFMPTGKYIFESAGRLDPKAAVFFSQRAAAYLVRGTPLGSPVLVRTGTSAVESVPEDGVLCRTDGGCDLKADVEPKSLGAFKVEGASMVIRVPGLEGRLAPAPPLAGWQKGKTLLLRHPEYLRDAKGYSPAADTLRSLVACNVGEVRVFVYFGTWCSTCQLLMGRILRTEEDLTRDGKMAIRFDYYAMPPAPRTWEDPEAVARGVDRLPTGLVYVNGLFRGRIVGYEWGRPEGALQAALSCR
jgi:hypothetical protein